MKPYPLLTCASIFILVFVMLLSPTQPGQASVEQKTNPQSTSEIFRILASSPEGVTLEFSAPFPEIKDNSTGEFACQQVTIPGLAGDEVAGMPVLPVINALLGIPLEGQPVIEIISSDETRLAGRFDICPAQTVRVAGGFNGLERTINTSIERGPFYQRNAFIPQEAVEVNTTGYMRSQRFVELRFNPVKYNPATGEVRYISHMVVRLNFNAMGRGEFINEGQFERIIQDRLLNYEQARSWRASPTLVNSLLPVIADTPPAGYKVNVDRDGIYEVSYADLQAAGVLVDELNSLDPRTFQLFNHEAEVAIHVEGQDDQVFNDGDLIRFYGEKETTKYTDINVYWLKWGIQPGVRMQTIDGTPSGSATVPVDYLTTQHVEVDTDYFGDMPSGPAKDHWYWTYIDATSAPSYVDLKTRLEHISTEARTARVSGLIKGYTAKPNHHTKIYINGYLIDDSSFPVGDELAFSASIPQSYLIEGENTIRVECPRDGEITVDQVLINWFEIDYYETTFAESDQLWFDSDLAGTWEQRLDGFSQSTIEVYDITQPLAPKVVAGGTIEATVNGYMFSFEATIGGEHHYLAQTAANRLTPSGIEKDVPSNWKSVANGADYIIISHANFLSQVQPLADYRAGQGYRVQVVNVQDLYDEFNGGVFSPEAIRSFLSYAYSTWQTPAPQYVLLVGDGHFDYKNIYGLGETNYIPPYLDDVDPWISETATDNRYVSVSGGDILPDIFIGRFPARNITEAQTMVSKTISYETTPISGNWNTRLTFVADNPDDGGDFHSLSDQVIRDLVPGAYLADKVYYLGNYSTATAARSALIAAINDGRMLVHYAGHASVGQWAVENLLNVSGLTALTNGSKLPFFLPMTCLEGYFVWPSGFNAPSLAESAVRINGKGAVASWSPTGFGVVSGHYLLEESLFTNLLSRFERQVGFLTTAAKYDLFARSSSYNDLIETYLLFGDPALSLSIIEKKTFLPVVMR